MIASVETLNLPLLNGPRRWCVHGRATTAEQNKLFANRNNAGANDICVYFVRSTVPPLNGCAAFPPAAPPPSSRRSRRPGPWGTSAGMCSACPTSTDTNRLMMGGGTWNITNPPPDLIQSEVTPCSPARSPSRRQCQRRRHPPGTRQGRTRLPRTCGRARLGRAARPQRVGQRGRAADRVEGRVPRGADLRADLREVVGLASRSRHEVVRVAAAAALAELPAEQASGIAGDLLADPDVGVRARAAKTAVALGDPALLEQVRTRVDEDRAGSGDLAAGLANPPPDG